ncbi:MAG: helix-turn-helix transcriptional regulator [Isosphaeraceae bacterium]
MDRGRSDLPELRHFAVHLARARLDHGLSQNELAGLCDLTQAQVSLFESGRRVPSLEQFLRLARALDVPLQRLLTGTGRPGTELPDLVAELRGLGAVDLWVEGSTVPGAARRPEEVIALAVREGSPEPRVVESLPALLLWNETRPPLLQAYGKMTGTTYRLAWLSEIALTIGRKKMFSSGRGKEHLEAFLKGVEPPRSTEWDDLGRPADAPPRYPAWKRWKIAYGATLEQFERRASSLLEAQSADTGRKHRSRRGLRAALGNDIGDV